MIAGCGGSAEAGRPGEAVGRMGQRAYTTGLDWPQVARDEAVRERRAKNSGQQSIDRRAKPSQVTRCYCNDAKLKR